MGKNRKKSDVHDRAEFLAKIEGDKVILKLVNRGELVGIRKVRLKRLDGSSNPKYEDEIGKAREELAEKIEGPIYGYGGTEKKLPAANE